MDTDVKLFGKIRGLNTDVLYGAGNEETEIELTGQAEQIVASASPFYSEISRQGRSFYINTAAEITSVITMPTTAVGFAMYNNEPDGGRSYLIDQVWAIFTANASILPQACLVGCLGSVREAIPTDAKSTTVVMKTYNGSPKFDSRSRVILTATTIPATTGFAGNWFPITDMSNAGVSALPGFQRVYNLDGRYIVPPGRYFGIHCVSAKTDVHCQIGIAWTEKYLILG